MLTRGKLATRTGCNIETIRYYEAIGQLIAVERSYSAAPSAALCAIA